jgi:hypothetical protein
MQCIVLHLNLSLSNFIEMGRLGAGKGLSLPMKKNTQFTFRVAADLKKELQSIAENEGRSMAQICEAFLMAGSEGYKKDRAKFLQRFLARRGQKARTD